MQGTEDSSRCTATLLLLVLLQSKVLEVLLLSKETLEVLIVLAAPSRRAERPGPVTNSVTSSGSMRFNHGPPGVPESILVRLILIRGTNCPPEGLGQIEPQDYTVACFQGFEFITNLKPSFLLKMQRFFHNLLYVLCKIYFCKQYIGV